MFKLNELELKLLLLKDYCKDNSKLILALLFVAALVVARLWYEIGIKWQSIDQAKIGTVIDNKHYALRFNAYFLCKVKFSHSALVDAYCFSDCEIGEKVKVGKFVTIFGSEQYAVLSCSSLRTDQIS